MRQTSFAFVKNYKKEFGGSLLENKRKSKRPLSIKQPLHLILKSSHREVFNPSNARLTKLIKEQAQRFHIKVFDFAVNWNHIHLLIQIKSRESYVQFIRALTSILATRIRSARPFLNQIFTLRPYTKIITWGCQFRNAMKYQVINKLEAFNLLRRTNKKRTHKANRKVNSKADIYAKSGDEKPGGG